MDIKEKTKKIISLLKKVYPNPKIALDYSNPMELLVSTILSAQCTDVRVNLVTPAIFKKYKTARDYANADIKEFELLIHSTGFYKNKAKNIINAAKEVVSRYSGKVPHTMRELLTLPGIGRKSANVILGSAFGIVSGIVVDTHVIRLSGRIGLSKNKNPEKIEQDLMKVVPKPKWIEFSHLLVQHGRSLCQARTPKCAQCPIARMCEFASVK